MNLETLRKAGDALENYLRQFTTEIPASSHWLAKVVLEAVEGDIRAEALRDAGVRWGHLESFMGDVGIYPSLLLESKTPSEWLLARAELNNTNGASDEYHTMDELYEYRMLYNAMAANNHPHAVFKSWRHSDGELCFGGGWFVVYMSLPTGWISNHYKAEYWDYFHIQERHTAPEYDGHTPQEAASRMHNYLKETP